MTPLTTPRVPSERPLQYANTKPVVQVLITPGSGFNALINAIYPTAGPFGPGQFNGQGSDKDWRGATCDGMTLRAR